MKRYLVNGIGTDVGKTLASAILCQALKADYWKPVQSGSTGVRDSETIASLVTNKKTFIHPEQYLLSEASSPHYAAAREGINIILDDIKLPATNNNLIIEAAGGLMVPLNMHGQNMMDLANHFGAEVILVIRQYLGCINHALLSIEALKMRKIPIAGLIFSGTRQFDNFEIITKRSGLPVIVEIPETIEPDKEFVAQVAKNVIL